MTYKIIPNVQNIEYSDKFMYLSNFTLNKSAPSIAKTVLSKHLGGGAEIIFKQNVLLTAQEYVIEIAEKISIEYSDDYGAYYAALTLSQILDQSCGKITCCKIIDKPDFLRRGVMLDISRGKVPTLETLCLIADILSAMKINELHLYIEGRAFYYEFLDKYYTSPNDFLTPSDVKYLSNYCKEKMIDLVPSGNCLGHMSFWLQTDEYKHLAEKPEGFTGLHGNKWPPSTLHADDKESLELTQKLFKELMSCFDSKNFSIGADEPFELGKGKTPPENAPTSYCGYISKLVDFVHQNNRTPMMWADVIKRHKEHIDSLGDVIFLEWGYEKDSFTDENCSIYSKINKPFYVCCGTSLWNSIAGISDRMKGNISSAAYYGKKHHALGILNTDWNDGGSLQQLAMQIFTYGYGAALSWNAKEADDETLYEYLDSYVYHCKIAKIIDKIGEYSIAQDEYVCNITKLFNLFFVRQTDNVQFDCNHSDPTAFFSGEMILSREECSRTEILLSALKSQTKDLGNSLYEREVLLSINILSHTLKLNELLLSCRECPSGKETIPRLIEEIESLTQEFSKIWLERNKRSDLNHTTLRMKGLKEKYKALFNFSNLEI